MTLYSIAVPVPLYRTFAYRSEQALVSGQRVAVTFANRRCVGICIGEFTETIDEQLQAKIKVIDAVLDDDPVFSEETLRLLTWLGEYYHAPLGEVLQLALPVALRKVSQSLTPLYVEYVSLTHDAKAQLQHGGLPQVFDTFGIGERAHQQRALLTLLSQGKCLTSVIKKQVNSATIKRCRELAVIETVKDHAHTDAWYSALPAEYFTQKITHNRPNIEQAVAIAAVTQALDTHSTFLLEGVTGSGKTEVYLQVIAQVLAQAKQVLILVPEIGLTPQTVQRFEQRFGIEVGVLHSGMTDKQRFAVWQKAKERQIGLVIGTRSAIFTPLPRLGLIVIDEEHDASFKQQDGVRYHVRQVAAMLAKSRGIPLLLGSATPTIETLQNALTQKFCLLPLQQRAVAVTQTGHHLIDLTGQPLIAGLADATIKAMQQHLKQGNQVMVFVNRRGFAPAVVCRDCGASIDCHACAKPFTWHRSKHCLVCHHCLATDQFVAKCAQCGSHNLQTEGVGTEQLASAMSQILPDYACVRIDSDTMQSKIKMAATIEAINKRQYQIIVGTQMLAKGHHFPDVTCVVIVDVDAALFSPDFRAQEHLAQLITQVAGRAGRAAKAGETYLQTTQPGHPLLQDLLNNGYGHFARYTLHERKAAQLPPFSYHALVRVEDPDPHKCMSYLNSLKGNCQHLQQLTLLGPLPGLMEKKQGRFRFQLLLQSQNRSYLQGILAQLTPIAAQLGQELRVRWVIDVDNIDFN